MMFELSLKTKVPVTKTHDGYFIIETESLTQGNNVMSIGYNFPGKYIIKVAG